MSLRSLKNPLSDRLDQMEQIKEVKKKLDYNINNFLNTKGYPQANIIYHHKEKQVILETPDKIFANELSLCLVDITNLLKNDKIYVDRIIIR